MELDPEVHAHHHSVGHRWIDIVLAVSALLLSVASILIAIENDHAMKRLVTANSWPYVEPYHGNIDTSTGDAAVHFDIKNSGVGPAVIEKLVVTYDGQVVTGTSDLLQRCCALGPDDHVNRLINLAYGVLAARETLTFLQIPMQNLAPESWKKLDAARLKVGIQVCYSSVFDEHWISSVLETKARSVDSCDKLAGPSFDANLLTKASS